MTDDCCVLKFLRRSVDGKHWMRFRVKPLFSSSSGIVRTENIWCLFRVKPPFSVYVHTKPDKFENATFAAKTDKMFSVHINRFQTVSLSIINQSSAILDQWLGRDCDRVTWLLWRQRFQKVLFSLSTLTHLAGVFKFIHFGERFQKVPFSDTENAVLVLSG